MKLTKEKLMELIQLEIHKPLDHEDQLEFDAERAQAMGQQPQISPDEIKQAQTDQEEYGDRRDWHAYWQKAADDSDNLYNELGRIQDKMPGKAISGLLGHLRQELDLYSSFAQGKADLKNPNVDLSREEKQKIKAREKPQADFQRTLKGVAEEVISLWNNDAGGSDRKKVASITQALKAKNLLKLKDRGFGTKLKSWFKGGGYNENLSLTSEQLRSMIQEELQNIIKENRK